jgi:Replication-relaxation
MSEHQPVARDLSDTAARLLGALADHRLLTVEQLRVLCGWRPDADRYASRQWISDQLNGLKELGYVRAGRQRAGRGKVWSVTKQGAAAAELDDGAADRRIVVLRSSQIHARTQAHTLAVNQVGVAFTRAVRVHGDACAWTNEVAHKVLEGAAPSKGLLRADAYLRVDCQLDDRRWVFLSAFVELDRDSETVQQLGEQLRRYVLFKRFISRGAQAPAWQTFYGQFPTVLVVFDSRRHPRPGEPAGVFAARTRARLEERLDALSAFCDADPMLHEALGLDADFNSSAEPELRVRCCLLADLEQPGPYEPVFVDPATGERSNLLGLKPSIAAGAEASGSHGWKASEELAS